MTGRCNGTGQLVDFGNQGRDATKKLIARRALIELNVRGGEALIHDIHDLRDDVMSLGILKALLASQYKSRYETYMRIDILEDGIKPDEALHQVLI